jgi:hypothetical protein
LYTSYSFIDASTEEYQEEEVYFKEEEESFIDASTEEYQEEEVYFKEEEENFDHCTTQGKLYSCKLP